MARQIFNCIKHAIINAIPYSLAAEYRSRDKYYNKLVSTYYPTNGVIDIGNMGTDKHKYSKDIYIVFNDYKVAARKEIEKKNQKQLERVG